MVPCEAENLEPKAIIRVEPIENIVPYISLTLKHIIGLGFEQPIMMLIV